MKIRIKYENKYINVDVNSIKCRNRECFVPGRYTHHSACGMSGCSNWTDKNYSCLTRDNRGCPDKYCIKLEEKTNDINQ